jgi:hypothetical protein
VQVLASNCLSGLRFVKIAADIGNGPNGTGKHLDRLDDADYVSFFMSSKML